MVEASRDEEEEATLLVEDGDDIVESWTLGNCIIWYVIEYVYIVSPWIFAKTLQAIDRHAKESNHRSSETQLLETIPLVWISSIVNIK